MTDESVFPEAVTIPLDELASKFASVPLALVIKMLATQGLVVVGAETYAALRARLEAYENHRWHPGGDIPEHPTEKLVGFGSGGCRWESEQKPVGYFSNTQASPIDRAHLKACIDEMLAQIDAHLDGQQPSLEPDYEALGYPETNVGFEARYLGPTMTDLIETLHVCVECAVAASPIKENDDDTDKG